jgi:DoxX-like family
MFTAYVAVTTITIVAIVAIAAANLAKAEFALANADEVHVPRSLVPVLATLKIAGAAGLLLGLMGAHVFAVAGGAGLVAFFICALGAHMRAHVLHSIAFPGVYFALAAASLALALQR